jgi:hypothetical protein
MVYYFTWTVAALSNSEATLTFTPPAAGSPVYDFNEIEAGDSFVILGPHFATGNRGEFEIIEVDVANKTIYFINSTAVSETVNLATTVDSLSEISFWHSTIKTIYDNSNYAYVGSQSGKGRASLPVNTNIVVRDSTNASYFPDPELKTVTEIIRLPGGSVGVTSSPALALGEHVLVSGFLPKLVASSDLLTEAGSPAEPGTPAGSSDVSQSSRTSVNTFYKGTLPVCVTDLEGNFFVIGGRDVDTSTDLHTILKYSITNLAATIEESIGHTYEWTSVTNAGISGTGMSAVVIDYPRFWNQILLVGGYIGGPDHSAGEGFINPASYLYSVATDTVTEITGTQPSPYLADSALVWMGSPTNYAVLIGGVDIDSAVSTYCTLWDPSYCVGNQLGKWYPSASTGLKVARTQSKAVALDNTRVLVIGGRQTININSSTLENVGVPFNTCEIITPNTTWSVAPVFTGQMTYCRFAFGCVKLPDNRILVVGGIGGKPCQPIDPTGDQQDFELKSCEIYDPILGYWSPIRDTLEAHSYCTCELDTYNNRVYVCGGAVSEKVEYLDLATMKWHFSAAEVPIAFRAGTSISTIADSRPIILRAGGDYITSTGSHNIAQTSSIQIYKETASSKGINGFHKVTGSGAANFQSPGGWTKSGTTNKGEVMVVTAKDSDIKGPYVYDKGQNFGLSGISLTPETTIPQGRGCPLITVTEDLTDFELTGSFILNFGYKDQSPTIRYRVIDSHTIQPDPHYYIPQEYDKDTTTISLISQTAAYLPMLADQRGAFYLTASNAGLEAAQKYLKDISATGIDLLINVRYPGDRGLGNEGLAVLDTNKLSDIIEVFGPDDLDTFLEEARNADQ